VGWRPGEEQALSQLRIGIYAVTSGTAQEVAVGH
jgi:hypothetical protein